jgi:hypothetical protein
MFQCQAISRRSWQSNCITTLRKQAESNQTDPKLVHILIAGMRSYFDDTDLPSEEFEKYPEPYHELIRDQEAIGWGHLVRCRFATLWGTLQQDYMHRAHKSIKFDEHKWYSKLLNPLLVECHTLWTLRNGERHGTEQTQKRTRRLQQLERELHDLYRYESQVLASDRDIFDTPITTLIGLPPPDIEKWIKSQRPIILHSRREAIKSSMTDSRLLPTYFHPLPRRKRRPTRAPSDGIPPPPSPSNHSLTAQLITEYFSTESRRPRNVKTLTRAHPAHRTLAQQPLLFGDNPT